MGLTLDWITVVNLLLEVVAALALYDIGRNIGGRWTGPLAAFLYVENPDIAIWNRFLLTDSLYAALSTYSNTQLSFISHAIVISGFDDKSLLLLATGKTL